MSGGFRKQVHLGFKNDVYCLNSPLCSCKLPKVLSSLILSSGGQSVLIICRFGEDPSGSIQRQFDDG